MSKQVNIKCSASNEDGEPVLKKIQAQPQSTEAAALEKAILQRMPERSILDILCNVEHWLNWTRHFGILSGSEPKIDKPAERYILTTFAYGCNLGANQMARHAKGKVTSHALCYTNRRHISAQKLVVPFIVPVFLMNFLPEKSSITNSSLLDILNHRAQSQPENSAYIFLQNGEIESASLSYRELDARAKAIASCLQPYKGERALFLYPPGLEFISAFFSCLYAGVIAVPVYPPRHNQKLSRLFSIIDDAQAILALTTTSILNDIKKFENSDRLTQLKWIATDNIEANNQEFVQLSITPENLAFLQYTSGSTGKPKGVMVTHGNIIHNQQIIYQAFSHSEHSIGVGWLPLFHDMGLIGHVLQPIYAGFPSILMSPLAFLHKPIRWLKAISKYRATTSGGPNFAYDLCVNKIQPEELSNLDLSSWNLAYSGAEPIRAETLEKFGKKFSGCGFDYNAFYPCYGMAETTLFVTGGNKNQKPVIQGFKTGNLKQNSVVESENLESGNRMLVGVGFSHDNTKVIIVNPESLTCCEEGEIGEIWVSGGSVASGYWNRLEETRETFQACLEDTQEIPFLRTGDLGFLHKGELFISGRLKDVIIIRGRNHYPQDIELTVEKAHSGLRANCGVAFAVEVEGEEKLVVVQEIERSYLRQLNKDEVFTAIQKQVSLEHELQVYAVVLIRTGSIPKTSSGKIKRHACRDAFLENNLSVMGSNIVRKKSLDLTNQVLTRETTHTKDKLSLILELCKQISQSLKIPLSIIKQDQSINNLGLDSLQAIEIKKSIENSFGVVISMEKFFEDITIEQLATDILNLMQSPKKPKNQASLQQKDNIFQDTSHNLVSESNQSKKLNPSIQNQTIPFSLLYFSSNEAEFTDDKYQLFIEGAKFADTHNFKAVWIPERHFHAFGGIYPNPSVLGAALAMVTKNIRIRAGSVVLPLHSPIRVAEDWSVVDNLSQGRVDIAFAMGWNPNDFVVSPNNYINRKEILFSGIETVKQLWEGKSISVPNGVGEETTIKIYPLPKQKELNVWITCSGGKERFAEAGSCGANILTALLFQSVEELADKITIYREARAKNGYAPETGNVTLMLHTFIGEDINIVREKVKQPFLEYLKSSVNLWQQNSQNLDELSEQEREDLLSFAFERYFQSSALFGTPDSCLKMVERLQEIGVNEIACLIDFGVDLVAVMDMLKHLNSLRELANLNHNSEDLQRPRETIELEKKRRDAENAEEINKDNIDLDSRFRLVYKSGKNVLQRAFEFELPDKLRETGILPYFRELERNEGATCIFDGRQVIMLGSNNYLGLTTDKRVREATARAALEDGPSLTGSRLLNGSTHKHREFERKLATFLGYEDVLIFTTGYQANLGLISALMNEQTTLVVDSEAHACIYDGAFMSRCKVMQYQHNDLQDLETKLQEITGKSATMVAIDGVYSMTGEIAPLPEIQILCDRHNATLMIDDAHGLGMLGNNGRGTEEHFNLVGSSDILCGTFSKSLASIGGWVGAKAKVIDWIRFHGRSMLFSASIPPTSLAAASTALDILIEEPNRVRNLSENARYWRDELIKIGFNVGQTQTPIVPIIIGNDMKCMVFGKELLEAGVYVNSMVYPAVPRTSALLRTSVMATHQKSHLDKALEIFSNVGKKLGLID